MSAANLYEVIRAPRVSEKTARLQEVSNQYVFEIAKTATKADVKAAVETIFSVKVEAVNVVNVKGKSKAFRNRQGSRNDWRKAYVTLAEGQAIDVMTVSA
ncbi:MAG: 50S ribosomal protein L23 [Thermomonas sp.]|uniref:50S ribosomal protein L23 n=1 Tax=Thermomonas sp. TaxID=1971895 RepID=UPI001EB2D9B9|nr:50S ribosomal protein L23 [Thermomonas sp.]MBV2209289.1 50S ribosomal protein L23 [Thermomonas sp.]